MTPETIRVQIEQLIATWITSEEYCLCCNPSDQSNMRHDPDQSCPIYELEQILAASPAPGVAWQDERKADDDGK